MLQCTQYRIVGNFCEVLLFMFFFCNRMPACENLNPQKFVPRNILPCGLPSFITTSSLHKFFHPQGTNSTSKDVVKHLQSTLSRTVETRGNCPHTEQTTGIDCQAYFTSWQCTSCLPLATFLLLHTY